MMAIRNRFQRIFWMVAGVHAALILTLFFYSGIRRWLLRRTPREEITWVTLHTPAPPAEAIVEASPVPAPMPAPPPPAPAPPRPRVERSTERVRRDAPPPQPTPPQLTPEQIRQRVQQAVSEGTTPTTGTPDDLAWYYSLIHQTMYQAWEQPGSVLPGTTVSARIRVMRDGSVTRRALARRSGNSAMDDSVMRALESVTRLSPLPREISGAHHDFTIEFELTGARR